MVRALNPILSDPNHARTILLRYWRPRMALVWTVHDLHKAANEVGVAITPMEAIHLLQELHQSHNPQEGLKWWDLRTIIKERLLRRKLTSQQLRRFINQDIITKAK